MYERGMGAYPHLARSNRGGSARGNSRRTLRPPPLGEGRRGDILDQWDWDFHTVRGDIDPRDHRFRPRIAGVVDAWKDF